jgi:hypothetical protein
MVATATSVSAPATATSASRSAPENHGVPALARVAADTSPCAEFADVEDAPESCTEPPCVRVASRAVAAWPFPPAPLEPEPPLDAARPPDKDAGPPLKAGPPEEGEEPPPEPPVPEPRPGPFSSVAPMIA